MYKLFMLSFFILNNLFAWSQSDYVFIKGGKFKMGYNGAKDQKPRHSVILKDFLILDHEVTNEEFVKFLNSQGNRTENEATWFKTGWQWRNLSCPVYQKDSIFYVKSGFENYPIVNITWNAAMAYCHWVGGRLPSEAEWEYVAQLSQINVNLDSTNILNYAVFKTDTSYSIKPVKSKLPIMGIFDLFGNVEEWCSDWYNANYYKHSPRKNPLGSLEGRQKVKRGGSWATEPDLYYVHLRKASHPNSNNITIGFRVVKDK